MHAKVKSFLLGLTDVQTTRSYGTHTYEAVHFFHGLVHDASHL